ncbi:helix-turn-helix domain-containing protein [uncultured Subdoligranulum sp.]|uniref:helix-turn-helix domain-containing protein n=1 Tax=uncultured Subdoligranulum sp. TaxID=512298 RepID=UPI002603736C|nr:helix-turn-helix domain-containing protein [uncultured Subdoligranulum sp.]
MTLGQRIQEARKNKGLSQEALAEQVGVSRQALGKWEKDTALPSLENLQVLACVLDVGVDELLGTAAQQNGTPEPTLTLDALRALLDARDADKRRRSRLWGGAALGVAAVLFCVMAGAAYQYNRQVQTLAQNYQAVQTQLSRTQAELSDQIEELQAAVRQGEATVLDWQWQPTSKVIHDLDGSWVNVQVEVTPRTVTDGMTGQLVLVHQGGPYDGTTELLAMSLGTDGVYRVANDIIFHIGETAELAVQWQDAAGTVTQEALGTVDCSEENFRPRFVWGNPGGDYSYGYRVQETDGQPRLTLTSYPVELEIERPVWMQVQAVTVELRVNGAAGEPMAKIELACQGTWDSGDGFQGEVWQGNFWEEETKDGWICQDDAVTTADLIVHLYDTSGNVWTDTRPLSARS